MIKDSIHPLIELMQNIMIVTIVIVSILMIYEYIIEPLLKVKYRLNREESIKRLKHQEVLEYKYNNQYNAESTRVDEEKQQLSEIKKEV